MARISVGATTTGVSIEIDTDARKAPDFKDLFGHFSEQDKFDALMALRYLVVSEIRRETGDGAWLEVIDLAHYYLDTSLGEHSIRVWSQRLGLTSAFAARDYGKALVHKPFRYL